MRLRRPGEELWPEILRDHLLADVPLGLLSSGGLDSSSVAVGPEELGAPRGGSSGRCPRRLIQNHSAGVELALDTRYLIRLRDPFHLFASRLEQCEDRGNREETVRDTRTAIDLWKNHDREPAVAATRPELVRTW